MTQCSTEILNYTNEINFSFSFSIVLGFFHTQSATNRDEYVKIKWNNIISGKKINFQKFDSSFITDFNISYDYSSILHYSAHAFSRNSHATIVPHVSI